MSSTGAFKRLMTHRITLTRRQRDGSGNFSVVSTHESVPAFVEWGRRLAVDRHGEEFSASAIVYLQSDAPVDPEHEHWQVTQTSPYTRGPVDVGAISPIDDPRTGRTHHYELALR